jgi:hypothetical protein
LLLEQEGAAMISAGRSTREDGGHLIVTLRGEPDAVDAASISNSPVDFFRLPQRRIVTMGSYIEL